METKQHVVGIDVSKARLDWAVHDQAEGGEVVNDEAGCRALLQRLMEFKPQLIVVEATGGLPPHRAEEGSLIWFLVSTNAFTARRARLPLLGKMGRQRS